MKNKLLAISIMLMMLVTYMPAIAFADDGDAGAARAYTQDGITYSISDGTATVTGYTKSPVDLVIPEKVEGATVTKIEEMAFKDCKTLKSVVFPATIQFIGNNNAEGTCEESIGSFAGCANLSKVEFTEPSDLKLISIESFLDCKSLSELKIPDGTEAIGAGALSGTSLTRLDLPSSLLMFQYSYIPTLQEINMRENTDQFRSEDGVLYEYSCGYGMVMSYYPPAKKADKYVTPAWADYVEGSCFYGEVDQVVVSGKTQMSNGGCIKCRSFVAAEDSEYYTAEDEMLYSKSYDKLFAIPQLRTGTVTIKDTVREISNCAGREGHFTSVVIPDGVKELPSQCFLESNLKTVTLPDSIEVIGEQAFQECNQLKIDKLPKSLKFIGYNAFWDVDITGVKLYEGFEVLGFQAFSFAIGLDKLILPSTVYGVETMGFDGLNCVVFTGDMPEMEEDLTWWPTYCYYPADNTTWDADKLKNRAAALDGREIWTPYTGDPEAVDPYAVEDEPDDPGDLDPSDADSPVEPADPGNIDPSIGPADPGNIDQPAESAVTEDLDPCKNGHSFSEWVENIAATEISDGEHTRTCTVCGVSETEKIPQLNPTLPSVKISKARAGKKSATVKWKKVSKKNLKKIAKLQIQYSTDKSFKTGVSTVYAKKSAASKKIGKLKKGKKYYFRIRAYKKSGSKICVSKWSKVKSAKVK